MNNFSPIRSGFQASQELYYLLFECSPAGMACVGLNGELLLVNQAFCDLLGYTREELLERSFQEITFPADLRADLEYVHSALAGKRQIYRREKRYVHKNGSLLWVHLTTMLLREPSDTPLFFLSVLV
jgi:PAS domain S-box-containing protein